MQFARPQPWRRASEWILAASTAGAAACLLAYRIWGRNLVQRLYDQDGISFFVVPDQIRSRATADDCYEWEPPVSAGPCGRDAGGWAGVDCLAVRRGPAPVGALRPNAMAWGYPCVVAATLFVVFQQACVEGPWYRIDDAMAFRVEPPFRHRVLFILVAKAIEYAAPVLTERTHFSPRNSWPPAWRSSRPRPGAAARPTCE